MGKSDQGCRHQARQLAHVSFRLKHGAMVCFSLAPHFAGRKGGVRGFLDRRTRGESPPHPKFALRISTSPRTRGEVTRNRPRHPAPECFGFRLKHGAMVCFSLAPHFAGRGWGEGLSRQADSWRGGGGGGRGEPKSPAPIQLKDIPLEWPYRPKPSDDCRRVAISWAARPRSLQGRAKARFVATRGFHFIHSMQMLQGRAPQCSLTQNLMVLADCEPTSA
jgi:hypothetical protein